MHVLWETPYSTQESAPQGLACLGVQRWQSCVGIAPRVPERDPDDHTDEDRAVLRSRLKNMAADAMAHLDAMHEDATRCMQVLAKTVQQLEEDDRTLHFALPLVDESLGLLDTSRARLGQALRTMATAEAHIHRPGEFDVNF